MFLIIFTCVEMICEPKDVIMRTKKEKEKKKNDFKIDILLHTVDQ
jgi:hypothetical protein